MPGVPAVVDPPRESESPAPARRPPFSGGDLPPLAPFALAAGTRVGMAPATAEWHRSMAILQSLWRSQKKRSSLHAAVKEGDLATVQELTGSGADVRQLDERGLPPLQIAAALGHLEIARVLIEKGADVNFVSEGNGTPLVAAAACHHPELIKLFICHNADLNKKVDGGRFPLICPYRPVVVAVDRQIRCVRLLVANGARINERNDEGNTALMTAAWFGNRDAVEELLRLGADPGLRNASHETAAARASVRGHEELANLLKKTVGY